MSEYIQSPLFLAITKVTCVLFVAIMASSLINKAAVRSILLSSAIIATPIILAISFSAPILKIIPSNTIEKRTNSTILSPQINTTTTKDINEFSILNNSSPKSEQTNIATQPEVTSIKKQPSTSVTKNKTATISGSQIITGLYLIISLIIIIPLLTSYYKILKFKTHPAHSNPKKIWDKICKSTHKRYNLLFTESTSTTFACGILSPKVIISQECINWPEKKLIATLSHELAHLKRKDPLTRLASSLVRASLWFHPLAWISHRLLIKAQEESCDQDAIRSGITPENYATELLETAASHNNQTPRYALSMATKSQIGKRIHRIINTNNEPRTTMKTTLTIITLTTSCSLIFATLGFAKEQKAEKTTRMHKIMTKHVSPYPLSYFSDKQDLIQVKASMRIEGIRLEKGTMVKFDKNSVYNLPSIVCDGKKESIVSFIKKPKLTALKYNPYEGIEMKLHPSINFINGQIQNSGKFTISVAEKSNKTKLNGRTQTISQDYKTWSKHWSGKGNQALNMKINDQHSIKIYIDWQLIDSQGRHLKIQPT